MRFQADLVGDKRALTFLRKLGKEGLKAVTRATNNTGRKTRTLASREIRNDVALKASYVRAKLLIKRATFKRQEYVITAKRRGVLMTRYRYRELKRGGITVKIKRKGSRKKIPRGFVTTLNAQGRKVEVVAVPNWKGSQGGRRAKYKTGNLKIRVIYSPSVSQVFNDVRDRIIPEIEEYFADQVDKEINQAIKRITQQ